MWFKVSFPSGPSLLRQGQDPGLVPGAQDAAEAGATAAAGRPVDVMVADVMRGVIQEEIMADQVGIATPADHCRPHCTTCLVFCQCSRHVSGARYILM